MTKLLILVVSAACVMPASGILAQDAKDYVSDHIAARADRYADVAQQIWNLAEVGYQETESSALLQEELREAGFSVEAGVAGMPTSFLAEWGSGGPLIAILAEFDALPGITNLATPERNPHPDHTAGHACGHHLFGTGSVAAAIAVKDWLEVSGTPGRIRLYGTPAEEGGAGKVYMVRDGLFDDVDVALDWHAGDRNAANAGASLANKSAKFRFRGVSSHAAGSPWNGRSALDGVEAMNAMVNMMREHVRPEVRIHYVITSGGSAPNVVPDFAEVYYYVRHPDHDQVTKLFQRVVRAAEGAAMGTGTTVDFEVIHGIYALVPNVTLAKAMHANLTRVGGVEYDAVEAAFARGIQTSLPDTSPGIESAAEIQPFRIRKPGGGSTDVGDVSVVVPNTGLRTATWVPGTSAHSWQAVAAGGMSIGTKGMIVAAKTLAMTAIDLFTTPDLVAAAKEEHRERMGEGFVYTPLLGDRPPPLDYRVTHR